jgi:DNA primase
LYLDPLINSASRSIVDYEGVVGYLDSRGITPADTKRFRLGYTSVTRVAEEKSADYKRLKDETYDWSTLRKKILFPLENSMGKVHGVIARPIKAKEGKPKYHRYLADEAKNLGAFFGLPQALPEVMKTGVVYVVEGALDCITLAKVYPNTVSALTAYLSEERYWMLKMIAEKICIVFDSDEAGAKGMEMIEAKYKDTDVSYHDLGYNDPNSCLTSLGLSKFEKYVKRRLSVLSF